MKVKHQIAVVLIVIGIVSTLGVLLLHPPKSAVVQAEVVSTDPGMWKLETYTDKMDSSEHKWLNVDSDDEPIQKDMPTLSVACEKNLPHFVVTLERGATPASPSSANDMARVRVRFDDKSPESQEWHTVSNGRVLALDGPENLAMVKKLAQSQSFLFEFTPVIGVSRIVHFDVRGFSYHYNSQTKTCGDWQ
jgi:hypothetical protein